MWRALKQGRQSRTLFLQTLCVSRQTTQAHTQLVDPAQATNQIRGTLYAAFSAAACHGTHIIGRKHVQPALFGGIHNGSSEWMFTAALQTARHAQLN